MESAINPRSNQGFSTQSATTGHSGFARSMTDVRD
jgi:hypothetical protein